MKKSLAVVLSFLMLLNSNISVLGAISAEAEKDVVVTQDENPLPDENQEPENLEFSEESEEMSIEEESEKDITENNTQSEEDVTDAEESETDSEEKEAVDSEGKSEPEESVSEPSEELNDESDSKNEADPKADNAEIDKTAEDGKDAEEFEEDEEISREDVEEDKTDEDAEGTEDAKLLASGNAVYYGEYGVWFDSVTHTITKGANRTSITIPSEIDGYIVSTIADYAFQNCYWLKSIDIPATVTNLGYKTFANCTSLQSITIPKTVTSGSYLFDGCTNLKEISFAAGTKSIPNSIINGCPAVEKINLPVGLLKLGDYAFANCAKLSSVTLPTTLTDMGQYTFKNCPALTSITIPKNVTAGSSLFNGCTNLTEVTFSAGAKSIPEKFLYASPAIINVNLPNGLMSLGEQAFACCYYLENITLPPSIIDLGNKTFFQCTSLKSITIPKNVTAGCDLFQECDSLREVIFASGIKRIPENFLRNAYNVESVKLPEGLLAIGDRAFMYCYALKNIVLPESLTDLGVESFNECVSLECITIPKNVSSGLDMFKKCTSLTKVVFAPGTKSIPIHFLRNAYNVKQIILPDGLLTIGDYAFDSCYNLSDIEIPSSVKNLGNMTFSNCVSLKTFTIPKNVEQYSSLFAGCTNLTEIFFEKGTVAIPDYAIEGAPVVKSIVIPEGVTTIGKCAFNGCTMLEKIVIPDTVTSIAPFWSFSSNCPLLKEITFPANACSDSDWYGSPFEYMSKVIFAEGTTKIPEYMFQGLKNHIEVYLPKSISEIPENTFENAYFVKLICNNEYAKNYAETHSITYEYNGEIHAYGINTNEKYKSQPPEIGTYYEKYKLYFDNSTGTITGGTNEITDLVIPESINGVIVEKIADNAFKNAVNLTSVSMPDTILTIGSEAFYNCIRLKSIVFSNGLYSMGTHVFDGCVSLEEVKLPSTLSDVLSDYPTDGNWFWNCKNLKKIVLTDGTTRILRNAFSCLPSLEMVIIPDSVTEIETGAFRNCYNLKNVVLPQELYSMGNGVFAGCISLEKITLPYSPTEGGGRWFSECYALKEITLSDGLSRIPAEAFYGTPVLESIIIPDTVTQIDEYAFAACNQLKSVSLSENLMGMGYRAFLMCQSLQEIKIPPNLTESYTSASQYKYAKGAWFENCYSLKKVTFEEGSTEIPSEALKYTFGMNEIVFPGTLSYINSNAFESCISLTEVTLPKSITSIASKAFCECRSLRSITIPMNISLLGSSYYESPFSKCTGLEKVIFSEGLKKIPDGAFNSVYSLKYIILPESVENISYKSFYNCISLKTIDYAGSPNSFKNIKIESGNDAIYNAAVICQKRNPVTTRESILRTVTLYAEVNLNTAASGNDNYVKSANVIATIGKKAYKPDENGKFVLPASGIAVFSADNYVSKSVSLNSVSNGTMIRLELKNDKDPIINEVMLEAVNIRSQTFKMSADYKGTIYASVNWNGCKEKAFYIENGNNIWKISNNKTEIIEFGNLINPNKKIFIVAVTANGQTYRKELHIQVEKAAPPEKMEVDIGANIPEIPADSIPYFGKDFKLKLNIPNFEASMSVKGDTATYIFGVDVAKYAKSKEYFLYDKGSKELYDKTTTTKDLNYAYDHLADLFKNTFSQMKYNHNNKKDSVRSMNRYRKNLVIPENGQPESLR